MKIAFSIFLVVSYNYGNLLAISSKLDFNAESREIGGTSILKSPKIQGVRVTVDTSKIHRSAESSSDEKDITSIDSKKKVGIRTDITFELDDEKNVSNSTSIENHEVGRDDDDDAGVPIFKGKPQPGEIPNPNRRTFYNSNDNKPSFHYDGNNLPAFRPGPTFHTLDDENINYNSDWSHFIPNTGIWTTERNNYPSLVNRRVPQNRVNGGFVGGNGINNKIYPSAVTWQHCDCNQVINSDEDNKVYYNNNNNNNVAGRRNSYNFRQINQPQTGYHPGVDDKLEEPFKVDRGK